ncbi:4078_t:CDS:2 [Entrophospora sp. SA101]|nr:4078_t:CDS:2 [Entrophospora sp. SA101]
MRKWWMGHQIFTDSSKFRMEIVTEETNMDNCQLRETFEIFISQ